MQTKPHAEAARAASIARPARAAQMLGVSKATVYRLVKAGQLPPPIRISAQATGWPEHVILDYIATRPAA